MLRKLGGVPPRRVETAIVAAEQVTAPTGGKVLRLVPIKSGLAQDRFPAEIWCGRWRSLSRVRRPADEGNPHAGSRQGLFLLSVPFLYLALAAGSTLTLRVVFKPNQGSCFRAFGVFRAFAAGVVTESLSQVFGDAAVVGAVLAEAEIARPACGKGWQVNGQRPSLRSGQSRRSGTGAEGGIRTHTPFGTAPSRRRVCQFHHFRTRANSS